jgi:hypothetical protein
VDFYPGLKAPAMKHTLVESAVKKAVDANNQQALPSWMFKICLARRLRRPTRQCLSALSSTA